MKKNKQWGGAERSEHKKGVALKEVMLVVFKPAFLNVFPYNSIMMSKF